MIREIEPKLDKIVVTNKEFKTIMKWWQSTKGVKIADMLDQKLFFPLQNFIIDLEIAKDSRLKGLVELDSFHPVKGGKFTADDYYFKWRRDTGKGFYIDGNGRPKEFIEPAHAFLLEALIYICLADRTTEYRPIVERDRAAGGYNPYEQHDRVCFLLKDIIRYTGTHKTKKSIQYQCECWGVRGHLRHYEDGRVVFIEPYKKGRKRDVLEPKSKTYMLGEEDAEND